MWLEQYGPTGLGVHKLVPNPPQSIGGAAFDANQNAYVLQGVTNLNLYVGSYAPCYLSPGTISVYTAASQWTKISRRYPAPGRITCSAPIAVDRRSDVFVAYSQPAYYGSYAPIIFEFTPATPTKPVSFAIPYFSAISQLAADSAGNLFVLSGEMLLEYAAGTTTSPAKVLPGVNVAAFTLDTQNDVWAIVNRYPAPYAIEEFAPGSTTPMRTIAGLAVGLYQPRDITVAQ
jgi:hypothetical protein